MDVSGNERRGCHGRLRDHRLPDNQRSRLRPLPGARRATIAAHGGRYLVRDGKTEVFEGDWQPGLVVVIEFDSMERAKEWLNSPAYAEIREMRARSTTAGLIIVDGV